MNVSCRCRAASATSGVRPDWSQDLHPFVWLEDEEIATHWDGTFMDSFPLNIDNIDSQSERLFIFSQTT